MKVQYNISFWVEVELDEDDPLQTDGYIQSCAETVAFHASKYATVLTCEDSLVQNYIGPERE